MITGPVLYVAFAAALVCYAGRPVVHGAKKAGHAIVSVFHHHKAPLKP